MPPAAARKVTPELARIVDELGQLEKEYALAIAPFEMKLPRIKALKEALQRACPATPEKEWVLEGSHFGARLGPCAMVKTIDVARLAERIGLRALIKFVARTFAKYQSCGVSALTAEDAADVVREAQTGPRRLSSYEKGIAA